MAQTDTEDRDSSLADVGLDVLDGLFHHRRVTRTVGNEETIIFLASQRREIVVPGDNLDLDSALDQASELVVLETNINAYDTDRSA